mmetsp:Transcript_10549/g.35007  ORF Transcript_10549/g.35007 Transcript_10549/m.35007 type:complete len:225 (+) Transcript_10549:457-1131(+)
MAAMRRSAAAPNRLRSARTVAVADRFTAAISRDASGGTAADPSSSAAEARRARSSGPTREAPPVAARRAPRAWKESSTLTPQRAARLAGSAIACSTDSFQSSPQAAEAEVAAGSTARRAEGRSDSSESSTTPKGVSGRKQVTAARALSRLPSKIEISPLSPTQPGRSATDSADAGSRSTGKPTEDLERASSAATSRGRGAAPAKRRRSAGMRGPSEGGEAAGDQ